MEPFIHLLLALRGVLVEFLFADFVKFGHAFSWIEAFLTACIPVMVGHEFVCLLHDIPPNMNGVVNALAKASSTLGVAAVGAVLVTFVTSLFCVQSTAALFNVMLSAVSLFMMPFFFAPLLLWVRAVIPADLDFRTLPLSVKRDTSDDAPPVMYSLPLAQCALIGFALTIVCMFVVSLKFIAFFLMLLQGLCFAVRFDRQLSDAVAKPGLASLLITSVLSLAASCGFVYWQTRSDGLVLSVIGLYTFVLGGNLLTAKFPNAALPLHLANICGLGLVLVCASTINVHIYEIAMARLFIQLSCLFLAGASLQMIINRLRAFGTWKMSLVMTPVIIIALPIFFMGYIETHTPFKQPTIEPGLAWLGLILCTLMYMWFPPAHNSDGEDDDSPKPLVEENSSHPKSWLVSGTSFFLFSHATGMALLCAHIIHPLSTTLVLRSLRYWQTTLLHRLISASAGLVITLGVGSVLAWVKYRTDLLRSRKPVVSKAGALS